MTRPVDEGQSYRLVAWVARVSVLLNVVLGLAVVGLSGALVYSVKRDKVQLGVVTIDKAENKILRVEPAYESEESFDAVGKALARHYVELREPIDLQTEGDRWAKAGRFGSESVNKAFRELVEAKGGPYEVYREARRRRVVQVVATTRTGGAGTGAMGSVRKYLVEWEARDLDPKRGETISRWYSHVVLEAKGVPLKGTDALINPYGLVVSDYFVSGKAGE